MRSTARSAACVLASLPLLGFVPYEWKGPATFDSAGDGVLWVRPTTIDGIVSPVAVPLVWYDAERQAIAVDPYADGFGNGTFLIDFNRDRVFSLDFAQREVYSGHYYLLRGSPSSPFCLTREGSVACDPDASPESIRWTEFTVPHIRYTHWCRAVSCADPASPAYVYPPSCSSGTWGGYAWRYAPALTSVSPLYGYHFDAVDWATLKLPEMERSDWFELFADWDVARGATVIYVRPLDPEHRAIPVTRADAMNVWVNLDESYLEERWHSLGGAIDPPASACPTEPSISAELHVTPRTLELKSKGWSVDLRLVLDPRDAEASLDPSSLRLSVRTRLPDGTETVEHLVTRGWCPLEVRNGGLVVRVDRLDLEGKVLPGTGIFTLKGRLVDGTRFVATGSMSVIR